MTVYDILCLPPASVCEKGLFPPPHTHGGGGAGGQAGREADNEEFAFIWSVI